MNEFISEKRYFTETEANQIKASLASFIGKAMFFAFDKAPANVIDIDVQQTLQDISVYGDIEKGFLILIQFESAKITLLQFCSLNALNPIYPTHQALGPGKKQQMITSKYMKGNWKYESGSDLLIVSIKPNNITVEGNINGRTEKKSFASGGHWLEAFVYGFISNPDYVIFYANETELGLGKLESSRMINGKYKWQIKLTRMDCAYCS